MEEEKKEIVIEIPGITPASEMGEKKQSPRPEFNPVPDVPEDKTTEPIVEIDDSGNVKTSEEEKPVEEKKEEPPKKVKEKIKYNKLNKALIFIFVAIIFMVAILCLLQFTNSDFSNYIWLNINGKLNDFNYSVMQYVPIVSQFGYIVFTGIYIILLIINIFFLTKYKNDIEMKSKVENKLLPFILAMGFVVVINIYFTLSDASHRNINEIYMRDHLTTKYKEEDLQNVVDYLKSRIFTYAESLDRNNGQIIVSKDPYEMAVEDLRNLSFKYEFLKGSYPKKIRTLNNFDLSSTGYPVGLTYNYTVGIDDVYVDSLSKIFVLTHEFCHVKGIVRESDADYCAFLAGFNSNNDVSKYSMYISLIPNMLYIMKDKDLASSIENEFGSMCLESGYKEICNLYYKDLYRFTKGSDTLEMYTYALDIYKEKKEELKQYLVGLNNRFSIKITTSEKKQVSVEEANDLIEKGSNLSLKIVAKVTEDIYNKNASYLKTVSDYFLHLYLRNSKEKEESYPNYNYLKPFPTKSNYATLTEKAPEYSYERAIRSILEYFDKYVTY